MAPPADPKDPGHPPRTMRGFHPPISMERARVETLPTLADPAQSARASSAPTTDGSEPVPLAVGSVVGERYVIEQHISSGGFGAVYRAADREIRHHQVALKLLHKPSASEGERQAALRELMLIASVSHPSVVQFKDYGWREGRLWFAMPWYRGRTLDRVLGDGMTRAEARPIFERIAQGLAAMHAVGIHHHDIKPENIFIAEIAGFVGGLPVLLDLGIATQRDEHPTGLTVQYASPETAAAMLGEHKHAIGAAADVFSLAMVLRNALDPSLETPTPSDGLIPLLHHRASEPVPLSTRRDLRYLAPRFRRWLSLDPSDRPSAAELADELSVLTAPEEQRQARLRLLKRTAPVALLAVLAITLLFLQVRRQKTVLREQSRELAEQRQVDEALRKQSEEQLEALETQAQTLGNERQQLKQALAVARNLNGQLTKSSRRVEQLDRKLDKVTEERDGLAQEKTSLLAERVLLTRERDELVADKAALSSERDRLVAERDQALSRAGELERRIGALESERDELTQQVAAVDRDRQDALRERDTQVERVAELTQQIEALQNEKRRLENRVAELEARPSPAATGEAPAP